MSKQFRIKVNGNSYLVDVEEVNQPSSAPAPNRPANFGQEVDSKFEPRVVQGSVSAPMPGVVTKILVSPGDQVKTGQTILVLEAMKMENEIAAEMSGKVQEVRVEVGQSVGPGDILAVIA